MQSALESYLSMSPFRLQTWDDFIQFFINDTPIIPTLAITSEEDPLCDVDLLEDDVIKG